ncbi:MAG TPA: hypothetical protein VHM20_08900 [Gammaproteobacteria bacterium]|nr:hypothetical protein [Gammaproteobacteria bacterium]
MKFFKKSKQQLAQFKEHMKLFYIEFRKMQSEYFLLLLKKEKTLEEKIRMKEVQIENFKLTLFAACLLAPIPFIVTSYFVLMPKKYWPMSLKKILNIQPKST